MGSRQRSEVEPVPAAQMTPATRPSGPRWHAPALLGGSVFLLSLALYLATLAPTITWRFFGSDSGELASAAFTWGVAHPTGYPLWTLLGFLVTRIPLGDPAARTNLLSALCGGATAAFVALAVLRLSAKPAFCPKLSVRLVAAAGAGLAFATAPAFWSQAILTETYTLNSLFVSIIVWQLAGWRAGARPRAGLACACGLALTNHSTALFTVAAVCVATVMRWHGRPPRAMAMLGGVALFVLPLLLYLLIPWRATQHPAENWNDPRTLGRFLELVSGSQYHYLLAWKDPLAALRSLPAIVRLFLSQFAWWALPIAFYGLFVISEVDPPFAVFSVIVVLAYAAFTSVYRAEGVERYLLPAYLSEAVLFGVGLAALGSLIARWLETTGRVRVSPTRVLAVMVAVTIVPFAAFSYRGHDLRHDHEAYDYAHAALTAAPAGATVRTNRDEQTFALWYLQKVRGFRRDVRVVDIRLAAP